VTLGFIAVTLAIPASTQVRSCARTRSELADYPPRYWPSLRVTVKARHFGFQLASQRTFHKRL